MERRSTTVGDLKRYLRDPFLSRLYHEIRKAGPIRSVSVDLTHVCNIRCRGCYFFAEHMDRHKSPVDEADFDAFLEHEKARGTNFVTVVGGEPSLVLQRLKKLHDNFRINVASNGIRRIPFAGFEDMPIGVSVWGDHGTDRELRGNGSSDIFSRALQNYKDDPRVFWYYTVAPGRASEIERVVERCVANGNRVLFNFYSDLLGLGGDLDLRLGFGEVRGEINRMIARYPDHILITSYFSAVVSTGRLYDEEWGYRVCTSVSSDNEVNQERVKNGRPYNSHFRAYNADLSTTRRCCTGNDRDCSTCLDVWEHFSWVMLNLKRHLGSKQEFANWLTTTYLFYLINRIIDWDAGRTLLPEIHRRTSTPEAWRRK